jgi:hypothetical protein
MDKSLSPLERQRLRTIVSLLGQKPLTPVKEPIDSPEQMCVVCERRETCPVVGFDEWIALNPVSLTPTPITEMLSHALLADARENGGVTPADLTRLIAHAIAIGCWQTEHRLFDRHFSK